MNFVNSPRVSLVALGLIFAGVLLFLDNLGILPFDNIGAYWPLALVIYGLGIIYHRRTASAIIWSTTLILAGFLLVIGNLHILRVDVGALWPLLLIAIGAQMLIARPQWDPGTWTRFRELRAERRQWRGGAFAQAGFAGAETVQPARKYYFTGSRLDEVAVFFSIKRRLETAIAGGELVAVFGSIELDLRNCGIEATLPGQNGEHMECLAIIDASAVFGSIDIIAPRNCRIIKEGAGVFGSYDDKTVPARPEPGVLPGTLILRGGAVFGSVTIRSASNQN